MIFLCVTRGAERQGLLIQEEKTVLNISSRWIHEKQSKPVLSSLKYGNIYEWSSVNLHVSGSLSNEN